MAESDGKVGYASHIQAIQPDAQVVMANGQAPSKRARTKKSRIIPADHPCESEAL